MTALVAPPLHPERYEMGSIPDDIFGWWRTDTLGSRKRDRTPA